MKKLVGLIVLLVLLLPGGNCSAEDRVAMFWNLENFFDPDIPHEDKPGWSHGRFYHKADMFAKTVLYVGTSGEYTCAVPGLIGVAEVENEKCVKALCRRSGILSEAGYKYKYVHFDSPDRRGIDVALLYLADQYELLAAEPISVPDFQTRDILHATLATQKPDTLEVFVCHFPSKLSGKVSDDRRRVVSELLLNELVKLPMGHNLENPTRQIIIMGDFNSDTTDPLWREIPLQNHALAFPKASRGTTKYKGSWTTIDLFFSSTSGKMQVIKAPFLLEPDKSFQGNKPRRTYIGPRYNGGVSDHLPVILEF